MIDKDYKEACGNLTDRARQRFEQVGKQIGGGKCEDILEQLGKGGSFGSLPKSADDVEFTEVKVNGDTATVKTKGDKQSTRFRKVEGDWKIDPSG
jgi:hypothetical protein